MIFHPVKRKQWLQLFISSILNELRPPQLIFESTGIYPRGMWNDCCVNQINYIQIIRRSQI